MSTLSYLRAKFLALYILRLVYMLSPWTQHPGKGLYAAGFFATLPLRALFCLIYYLPPGLRPHPQWSYHQAVGHFALGALFSMWTTIHYHPTKTLDPGPQGDPFVSLTPSKACSYLGVLDDQHIKPITIGAMWYPRLYSPVNDSGKKVFLYFHGGAYVLGGCRPSRGGYAPELLAKVSGGTTLAPQYRLAWQHGGCFPAPIQDAITAYAHLLSLGIKAEDIIFSGESAGGNLALVTLRYLINHGASAGLPRPGGVCVFSPWVDMTMTADEILKSPQFRTDWLPTELPDYATDLYVPLHKRANDEYMSILGNEFATDVPIFVQTGDAEILYDSNVAVVEGMRKKGARVACHVIKNAGDDAFGTAPVLGLTREAENIAAAAIKFIEG